ncbi:MAG: ribosome-associated translation inhibitor RaiA [Candidatus Omnitrophica bacterium]|nr:ribosome-associated translation inhibitor RaiA [Candidatus Omnitrophota bacterium]
MDIRFLGKNMTVTKGMREHFQEKLDKLDKYAPRIVESHVILKKEKYGYVAEMTLLSKNFRAFGEGQDKENIYTAIDLAYHRIQTQLKKHREKVKSHHRGHGEEETVPKIQTARKINQLDSGKSKKKIKVIRLEQSGLKPMSTHEASLQLEVDDKDFLVFHNDASDDVNVIFRLKDGHFGLIEP